MKSGRLLSVRSVAEMLDCGRTFAYRVMHEAGAVKYGGAPRVVSRAAALVKQWGPR